MLKRDLQFCKNTITSFYLPYTMPKKQNKYLKKWMNSHKEEKSHAGTDQSSSGSSKTIYSRRFISF